MFLQRVLGLAGRLAGTAVGASAGVVAGAAGLVTAAASGTVAAGDGRVHVALRGVHAEDAAADAERVERLLGEHDAVRRAEVNAVLGHVMVSYDHDRLAPSDVRELVADAQRRCGLDGAPHAPAGRAHPGAPGTVLRTGGLVGLHVLGLAYSTVGRVVPLPAFVRVTTTVLSLVDAAPRLRGAVEDAIGPAAADSGLSGAVAVVHALGGRPVDLLVAAGQRYVLHQEACARRRAWAGWEQALAGQPGAHRSAPLPHPPRPVPLPRGPVERVGDGSAALALAGSAVALVLAGNLQLAHAALTAGLPRAAQAGREGFAAQFGRDLAARGGLVLDPAVLRRFDRVDTVVLDSRILVTGRYAVDEVRPTTDGPDPAELVERVHDLVDLRRPGRRRARGAWVLEPVGGLPGLPARAREAAVDLAARSATVLVLRRDGRVVALAGVSAELDPFAEAVVAAAGRAGRVLVACSPDRPDHRLPVDGVLPGGDALAEAVRELQAGGHVVALVAAHDGAAGLAAADVGIGASRRGEKPPWGADVLVRGAGEACLLLDAVAPARRVSRRSARLAVAGSAFGMLLGALGSATGAPARAALPVQTAALLALGTGTLSAVTLGRRRPPLPADRTPWHAMSAQAVLETLGSSRDGLTDAESGRRHREQPAEPDGQEAGIGRAVLEELANPLTPALVAGAGVSASSGSLVDPLLITTVVAVNALIGGVQRVGAQRSLRRLRRTSAARVRVRRGGAEVESRAAGLVAGDVVTLNAGDAVPADCRLLGGQGLEVDESSLTGESALVAKSARATAAGAIADRHCMLYEGTVVAAGRASAVVVATGERTEVGRALHVDHDSAPPSGVEARLRTLTSRTLPISVGAGLTLVVVDLLRRRPLGTAMSRAVSLAVAAVPEGLPFVATVAELAAARRLSRRGALVRNTSTIEALGRVDVLCFDKTGTLTEGRISLRRVSDGTRAQSVDETVAPELAQVVAAAVRASPFHAPDREVTHQTDRAVLRGARRLGLSAGHGTDGAEHVDDLAFESNRGYHATLWRGGDGTHVSVKGAPEVVLPRCVRWRRSGRVTPLDAQARAGIGAEIDRLARRGERVLAVAERPAPGRSELGESDVTELEFRGLVGLVDPVRPTAATSVATLRAAGVDVVMITGDHPSTAESIAAELDALNGRRVLTGAELDALDDDRLAETLPETAVFARVTPTQKARVVEQLQRAGRAVAVTGDGANDAAAIRLADVGLALGVRATPAAREAADVVITDDRIETITDAIVEGRAMWSSVRDALAILLGGNLGEIAYTVGTGVLDGGAALNARQLLLVNLLTDVLPAMAVAVRPPPDVTPDRLLAEGPEESLGSALSRDITLRAATTAAAASAAWLLARPVGTAGQASTTGLVALVGAQLLQTMAVRGRTPLVTAAAAASLAVLGVVVQVPGLSHVVGCRPLLPHQWALALTAAAASTGVHLVVQRLLRPATPTGR